MSSATTRNGRLRRILVKLMDPDFARWFDRLGAQLSSSPPTGSEWLRRVQAALIDLIDVLDPTASGTAVINGAIR
jgi:hypothetical protein